MNPYYEQQISALKTRRTVAWALALLTGGAWAWQSDLAMAFMVVVNCVAWMLAADATGTRIADIKRAHELRGPDRRRLN